MNNAYAPPQSADTKSLAVEEALLGSILSLEEFLKPETLQKLKPSDFYLVRHEWIMEAILTLHTRGDHIDNMTVDDELRRSPERYKTIGGSSYLTYLINSVADAWNVETYAAIVLEQSRRRQALLIAQDIANSAINADTSMLTQAYHKLEILLSERRQTDDMVNYFFHVSELKNLPKLGWLIPGEIPERGLALLFGPSGIGKSFVALDYAMRLAAESFPIVYIAAEGESGYLMRTAAWCNHHGISDEKLNLHFFMNIVSLLDNEEHRQFIEVIRRVKPKLVVVDTLAHCMLPGDENNTRDMGLFVRASKDMRNELDCSVLMVHHTGKEGKHERGNSALRAACDVMIRLTSEDDVIRVECSKTKDAEPFPDRFVQLLPVTTEYGSTPVIISTEKVIRSASDKLTRGQLRILELMTLETFSDGASVSDIVDGTELSRRSVFRILSALISLEHITKVVGDKPYMITEQGKSAVDSAMSDSDSANRSDSGFTAQPSKSDSVTQNFQKKSPMAHLKNSESPMALMALMPENQHGDTVKRCFSCGGTRWHSRSSDGTLICSQCHP